MRAILPEPGWPRASAQRRHARRRRLMLSSALAGPDALIVVGFSLLAVQLLIKLPALFGVDSWLELASGRLIAQAGIPHHETLTALAKGKTWIDQQWLAQLISYMLYRLGGLALLGVTNIALLMSGLSIAVGTARRLGASIRDLSIPVVLCSWLLLAGSEVRTQAFAIPLFASVVWLLACDSRQSSRRVYWTLPVLVLWANLHGSAVVGAGLVALRGLTLVWEERSSLGTSFKPAWRPLALIIGAPLSLFVTPYGLRVISYYQSTLGSSALRSMVSEWRPVTSSVIIAVPFFLLVAAMLWSLWRSRARSTHWDRVALASLAVASIGVSRNVVPFALTALAVLPVWLGATVKPARGPSGPAQRRVNATAAGLAVAVLALVVGATLSRPITTRDDSHRTSALVDAIQTTLHAHAELNLWADTRYGDWLLWRLPALSGRLASDARYELYTAAQLHAYQRLSTAAGPDWKQAAKGFRLLVLNRSADATSIKEFLAEPGARVLFADRDTIVILRPATQA